MAKGNAVTDRPDNDQVPIVSDRDSDATRDAAVSMESTESKAENRRDRDDEDQMVMQSYRITKAQARALEIVSTLTGRKKAEIVREAIDEKITKLASMDSVEQMAAAYRERLLQQTKALQESLALD